MTSRDRRAMAVGAAVIGAGLLFGRLAPMGLRHWRAAQGELADRTALLAREQGDLGRINSLEDSAKSIEARFVGLAPQLLSGSSDAEGIADLEGRINLAAGRHRTRVVAMNQVADSEQVARLRGARVTVQVESDWGGLIEFLRALDDDPAALRVTALSVSAADPTSSSAHPEVLRADLQVSGWYLGMTFQVDQQASAALSSRGAP